MNTRMIAVMLNNAGGLREMRRRTRKLNEGRCVRSGTHAVSIALFWLLLICVSNASYAEERFVSPNGDNRAPGTIARPWKTLKHALEQLSAGDILNLREGTYYLVGENRWGMDLTLSGNADKPITVRSRAGETAVIDGGIRDFAGAPNNAWEMVDASIGLYRSRKTFEGISRSRQWVRAWLLGDDKQLVEYESTANIESTNYGPVDGNKSIYLGPGIQLRDDERLYIRLQYNPNDLTDADGNRLRPVPADVDPNSNRISVFFAERLFSFVKTSHIHFHDLHFRHAKYLLDVDGDNHHVQFEDCRFDFGRYALLLRDGARDWKIHRCEFNNGLPDYVYWTDVKNRNEHHEAHPEFQSCAVSGQMSGFTIEENIFRDSFDAITVGEGTNNAVIRNNVFRDLRDDAINLSRGIADVEVDHNLLWHVNTGISCLSSDTTAGHVFIHHNIIDNSAYHRGGRVGNYRQNDWPTWTVLDPFGSHDAGNKEAWWKIYNNTIVTRLGGYKWADVGPGTVSGNPEKCVYNNIFYVRGDRLMHRDESVDTGSHYDGNVYWRSGNGKMVLFYNFGNGGRFASLAKFREKSGTDWETLGLQVDPGFDLKQIDNPRFDPVEVWNRYRPTNQAVMAEGVDYPDDKWPGSGGTKYRGAIGPTDRVPEAFNRMRAVSADE